MGIVGWFILGMLIIAFTFFGLNSYLDSDVASYVASVNGVEISERQENIAYRNLRSRMEDLMAVADAGEVMPPKSTWFEPKLVDGLVSLVFD